MIVQPLAEVFGHPCDVQSEESERYRKLRLCPYNNKGPNCNKDKAENPLGVCSIYNGNAATVVCPVRLRQDWLIIEDAATSFFPPNSYWTTFTDVKLFDLKKNLVGILDFVLVCYDSKGQVLDFGVLETQASYVTKNLRSPFQAFIENPENYFKGHFRGQTPYPDYQATIQRRLAPRLIYKGSIIHSWKKKMAIALDHKLYENLPELTEVSQEATEITWFVYALEYNELKKQQQLKRVKTSYTLFEPTIFQITNAEAGPIDDFIADLQLRLDEKLEYQFPPDIGVHDLL